MLTKQLNADAPAASGGATTPTKKSKKDYTPNADADFLTVSKKVNETWLANPAITLIWIKQPAFAAMVADYDTQLGTRLSDGSFRPGYTQTRKQIDQQMDDAVTEVKVYIEKKYKKANAVAQYARYGIVHSSDGYQLPKDKDNRLLSLPLMIAAIAADGFGAEEYGTAFWTNIKASYETAVQNAGNTDGAVSKAVGNKNLQKKNISKVMSALRYVLRGNYPDTYKAVYREWGWQKEDY